jgi:hypothetical protein
MKRRVVREAIKQPSDRHNDYRKKLIALLALQQAYPGGGLLSFDNLLKRVRNRWNELITPQMLNSVLNLPETQEGIQEFFGEDNVWFVRLKADDTHIYANLSTETLTTLHRLGEEYRIASERIVRFNSSRPNLSAKVVTMRSELARLEEELRVADAETAVLQQNLIVAQQEIAKHLPT